MKPSLSNGRFGALTGILHQCEIGAVVVMGKEHQLTAIAALGDVMRIVRDDESGHPGHR